MVLNQLYRALTRPLQDRWLGGLHAGLAIKGLYLQWMVTPFLRQGHKRVLDAGCGPKRRWLPCLRAVSGLYVFRWDSAPESGGRRRDRIPGTSLSSRPISLQGMKRSR